MDVVSIQHVEETRYTGSMSDGSDRQAIIINRYDVLVRDGKRKYAHAFYQESTPTETEIHDSFYDGKFTDITSDKEIIAQLETELQQSKLEQAQANTELFEMILTLTGGGTM